MNQATLAARGANGIGFCTAFSANELAGNVQSKQYGCHGGRKYAAPESLKCSICQIALQAFDATFCHWSSKI